VDILNCGVKGLRYNDAAQSAHLHPVPVLMRDYVDVNGRSTNTGTLSSLSLLLTSFFASVGVVDNNVVPHCENITLRR